MGGRNVMCSYFLYWFSYLEFLWERNGGYWSRDCREKRRQTWAVVGELFLRESFRSCLVLPFFACTIYLIKHRSSCIFFFVGLCHLPWTAEGEHFEQARDLAAAGSSCVSAWFSYYWRLACHSHRGFVPRWETSVWLQRAFLLLLLTIHTSWTRVPQK